MKLRQIVETDVPDEWENDNDTNDVNIKLQQVMSKMKALEFERRYFQNIAWEYGKYLIHYYDKQYDQLLPTAKWKVDTANGDGKPDLLRNDTPNGDKVRHLLIKARRRMFELDKKIKKLDNERRAAKKAYREQGFKLQQNAGLPQQKVAELAKTSHFIIGTKKKKIANPLARCELSLYAGPPDGYPDLTSTQVDLFLEIQDALKTAGLEPLTMLYGGRLSKHYQGINFVAIGANGNFAWRKYDPGAGAGQNWVFFKDGSTMNTSAFVEDPQKYLDKHMK